MSTYRGRRESGDSWELTVKSILEHNLYKVELTGIEARYEPGSPEYRRVMEASEAGELWALRKRYRPDFFAPGFGWVDAKRSKSLERYSFELCSRMEREGEAVYFAIPVDGRVCFTRPSFIRWEEPNRWNNARGLPTDGVWRCPSRVTADWTAGDAAEWVRRWGSGKEFAAVDLERTRWIHPPE